MSVVKFRDLLIADDVAKMYELGRYDHEFECYGCVYLENRKRFYFISSQKNNAYAFVEKCRQQGKIVSNVCELHENCAVPSGTKEILTQRMKRKLAKKIQSDYSVDLLCRLDDCARVIRTNDAALLLSDQQEQLLGSFAVEKLNDFEALCHVAYTANLLLEDSYIAYLTWLAKQRRYMEDDIYATDVLETDFYGIAALDSQGIGYYINTHREIVAQKKVQLEREGVLVTPIHQKLYGYNHMQSLYDIRRRYEVDLKEVYSQKYVTFLQMLLRRSNQEKARSQFNGVFAQFSELSVAEMELLRYYTYLWRI